MEKIFKKIMVTHGFTGIGALAFVMTLLKDFRIFLQRYFMDFLKEGYAVRCGRLNNYWMLLERPGHQWCRWMNGCCRSFPGHANSLRSKTTSQAIFLLGHV